jgi:hypothetical protein|tara:strand:+ start:10006 stop:10146 length:141 start_codon:yes stop_codon:yes gene_type:complete
MDHHFATGLLGAVASWGLVDVHLAAATTAAILTCVYMGVAIYRKFK